MWLHPSCIPWLSLWKTPGETDILLAHTRRTRGLQASGRPSSAATPTQVNHTRSKMPRTSRTRCEGGWDCRGAGPVFRTLQAEDYGPLWLTALPSVLNLTSLPFLPPGPLGPACPKSCSQEIRLQGSLHRKLQALVSVAGSRACGEL